MIAFVARLALAAGIPARAARAAGIAALIAVALALLATAKCTYDRNLIRQHDAAAEARALKADAKAQAQAAIERRADDMRISESQKGLNDAIDQAPTSAPDAARVALNCERLHRQGWRGADLPAACRPDR